MCFYLIFSHLDIYFYFYRQVRLGLFLCKRSVYQVKADHVTKEEEPSGDSSNEKQEQQNNNKSVETKALKNTKLENDKLVKGKATKTKTKKIKLGKKDEVVETKAKEDVVKAEVCVLYNLSY